MVVMAKKNSGRDKAHSTVRLAREVNFTLCLTLKKRLFWKEHGDAFPDFSRHRIGERYRRAADTERVILSKYAYLTPSEKHPRVSSAQNLFISVFLPCYR